MRFRELIKKMQIYSGFSDSESKEALEHMVESLSVRLNEGERKDFASQLPEELKNIALSVLPTKENSSKNLVQDFMITQHIEEDRAKKQILCAWRTLKDAVSEGEINDIRAQLPNTIVNFLH